MRDDPPVSNSIFEPAPASSPPPPTRLLFANPPFPSIDPTARGKRQLIVKKKKAAA